MVASASRNESMSLGSPSRGQPGFMIEDEGEHMRLRNPQVKISSSSEVVCVIDAL
jgi:hypothetical protein